MNNSTKRRYRFVTDYNMAISSEKDSDYNFIIFQDVTHKTSLKNNIVKIVNSVCSTINIILKQNTV